MVLKLYGDNISNLALRVAHVLTDKQVPFEYIKVDMIAGKHKSPEHAQRHPFGQIPYIDDDGLVLYESRAICKYIATKWRDQGVQLIPDPNDLEANALFDQALSIEQNNFEPITLNIMLELKYKPLRGEKTDEKFVESLIAKLEVKLNGYETILSKQKYLAGENLTLADIYHLAWGAVLIDELGVNSTIDEKRPHVARWFKNLSSLPGWLAVKNGLPYQEV
ncbi:glutathione transferase [Irpex rosettiformis]|uniref:Glutathione transferase n=1 Tax=Irpex rosettiformis TaxID=378272 RepID=A0ACB8UDD8_9APHY|nr:glutathione transferase [Irpex rosettiformis]